MERCSTENCINLIEKRGTLFCESCNDEKKKKLLARKQQNNDEIFNKLISLQKEYEETVKNYETKIKLLSDSKPEINSEALLNEISRNEELTNTIIKYEKDKKELLHDMEKLR